MMLFLAGCAASYDVASGEKKITVQITPEDIRELYKILSARSGNMIYEIYETKGYRFVIGDGDK